MNAVIAATLRAIEERLTTIEDRLTAIADAVEARGAPAEHVRQGLDDILRIYGITAQTGEVMHGQRNQIQALAEAVFMLHAKLMEHDKRVRSGDTELTDRVIDLEAQAAPAAERREVLRHEIEDLRIERADEISAGHDALIKRVAALENPVDEL